MKKEYFADNKALMDYVGERRRFIGEFVTKGKKRNYKGKMSETILLKNIEDEETGIQLKNHTWCCDVPELLKVELKEGDVVSFESTVGTYIKGNLFKNKKYAYSNHISLGIEFYGIQKVVLLGGKGLC
ncbi:MAG: hypothetical protein ACI4U3_08895 [Traorella sp.]